MVLRSPYIWMAALALMLAVTSPISAAEVSVDPPSSVRVDPLSSGGALNVSWDPNGTNASSFHVYLVIEGIGDVPIGVASASAPWFVHSGLTDGTTYVYVVVSDDAAGTPTSRPSMQVSGVPHKVVVEPGTGGTPVLVDPCYYVRSHILNVTGVGPYPGDPVEVETFPLVGGLTVNRTVNTDPRSGSFATVLTMAPGMNIVHARCIGGLAGPGPWSEAYYVVLDVVPPIVRVTGAPHTVEQGTPVYLSAQTSSDDHGISTVVWDIGPPFNLTMEGVAFTSTFNITGQHMVNITVTDLAGNMASDSIIIEVLPFDAMPRMVDLPDIIEVGVSGKVRIPLNDWVIDEDDDPSTLAWYVSGGNDSLFTTAIDGNILVIMGTGSGGGEAILSLYVSDPHGKSANGTVVVSVSPSADDGGATMLPMLSIGLGTVGTVASGALIIRRRTRRGDKSVPDGTPAFYIKGLYLIHNDGRLIKSQWAVAGGIKDPDMVGSMFTAIQEFVCHSFEGGGTLESVMFGKDHLTITRGRNLYLATLSLGPVSKDIISHSGNLVRRIEAEYAGILDDWDGSQSRLTGLDATLRRLLEFNGEATLEDVVRKSSPVGVRAMPSIEFKHGMVCYRLRVENDSDSIMVDAYATLEWDHDVLHLKSVKPQTERFGGRVHLGNIAPGEGQGVELCFDPQTCLESFVRGVLVYMDIHGRLLTMDVESTLIDVNCPIFFTVGNANTAMLHRLVEELENKDNRVLRFARVLESRHIYRLAKSVIAGYDVTFVQEFTSEDPFTGEAWYYGETKIHDYKVVVRITVRETENTLEFFVAATHAMTITGLLAELKRLFLMKLDELCPTGRSGHRIMSRSVKEEMREDYLTRPTLYEMAVTGAADKKAALKRDLIQDVTKVREGAEGT